MSEIRIESGVDLHCGEVTTNDLHLLHFFENAAVDWMLDWDGETQEGTMRSGDLMFIPARSGMSWRWRGHNKRCTLIKIRPTHDCGSCDAICLTPARPFQYSSDKLSTVLIHVASEHAEGAGNCDGSANQAVRLLCFHLEQQAHVIGAQGSAGLAAWQVKKVKAAIKASPEETVPLKSLAELARLSPTHFCTAFRQTFGTPPHRWQVLTRVERARRKMADPATSLTSIAHDCGFKSSSHFARVFKKVHGICPSQYRKRM